MIGYKISEMEMEKRLNQFITKQAYFSWGASSIYNTIADWLQDYKETKQNPIDKSMDKKGANIQWFIFEQEYNRDILKEKIPDMFFKKEYIKKRFEDMGYWVKNEKFNSEHFVLYGNIL